MNLSSTCRIFAGLQPARHLRLRNRTRLFGPSGLPLACYGSTINQGTTARDARLRRGYCSLCWRRNALQLNHPASVLPTPVTAAGPQSTNRVDTVDTFPENPGLLGYHHRDPARLAGDARHRDIHQHNMMRQALDAGAGAYLVKSRLASDLSAAIDRSNLVSDQPYSLSLTQSGLAEAGRSDLDLSEDSLHGAVFLASYFNRPPIIGPVPLKVLIAQQFAEQPRIYPRVGRHFYCRDLCHERD